MAAPDPARLTDRQRECLRLVHQGYRAKEIALQLSISEASVKEHLSAARERLGGVPTSIAAARLLASLEGEATPPKRRPPPSRVPEPPPAAQIPEQAAETSEAVLADSEVPTSYAPATIPLRVPLPTATHPVNDLTWRGKLLWGLAIAFTMVALLGAFKAFFRS